MDGGSLLGPIVAVARTEGTDDDDDVLTTELPQSATLSSAQTKALTNTSVHLTIV